MSYSVTAAVWSHARARGIAKLVLLWLANRADEHGYCYPGLGELAARTGLNRRTIQRLLRQLEVDGELTVTVGGGRRMTSRYRITVAERAAESPSETAAERRPFTDQKGGNHASKGRPERAAPVHLKGGALPPEPVIEPVNTGTGHLNGQCASPPTPSPQAGRGTTQTRVHSHERRNGTGGADDTTTTAPSAERSAVSLEDAALWNRMLAELVKRRVATDTVQRIRTLVPVRRREDGSLLVHGPSGDWWVRHSAAEYIGRWLQRVGDPGDGRITVVDPVRVVRLGDLAPATEQDHALWRMALDKVRSNRVHKRTQQEIARYTLVGRHGDGALVVTSPRDEPPPGRFCLNYAESALAQVGDPGGGRIDVLEDSG